MIYRVGYVMLCLFALLPPLAVAAQPLDRLFFTPEQRARMDVARQQERGLRIEDEEAPAPPPANIILNGVVTRSDGKATVWINNQPQSPEKASQAVGVEGRGGQLKVTVPDARRGIPLKVGQSLDVASGKVEEVYRRAPLHQIQSGTNGDIVSMPDGGSAAQQPAAVAKPSARELRKQAKPTLRDQAGADLPAD